MSEPARRGSSYPTPTAYVGGELELFQDARNWKSYVHWALSPYIRGAVAEVGAGIGATTASLSQANNIDRWVCIEPDTGQCARIEHRKKSGEIPDFCTVLRGTLRDLPPDPMFDTIMYIDVLEHIEDDHEEVVSASKRLRPNGRLIVLVPAYQSLYSKFDGAVGHFRRYSLRDLENVGAHDELTKVSSFYLDSIGLMASIANKWLLRQELPTRKQIKTWDRCIVPVSRRLDPLMLRRFGRSAVVVWTKGP